MNSVLRSTIFAICTDTSAWECAGSGTILRPQVVVIDSSGTVIEEWFKSKRWVESSELNFRAIQPLWWIEEFGHEKPDSYHTLEQKIADLYSEIRAFLLRFATKDQLRKDDLVKTIITFIRSLYREQVGRNYEDFPCGKYSGNYHLELDMRRSAGDRLALVWASSKEVTNATV